jgi:protein-L-isoaspartate(D-aspartate) O-methyltransferase
MIFLAASVLVAVPVFGQLAPAELDYAARRAELVREVERNVRATRAYTDRPELDQQVMAALAAVPRHEFVPVELRDVAYLNRPLPIGQGQTISQPYIVALMTDLADIDESSVVLEVGTGSGYQAAVLAEIVEHVYTIEIVEPLGRRAAETLERLGYDNVTVRIGDGYLGWPEAAPFDAIIVTAAPEQIPKPLIEQLAAGGRLVVPVGAQGHAQTLQRLEKDSAGGLRIDDVLPVMFVPLTRDENSRRTSSDR